MKTAVILPAAGLGTRMQRSTGASGTTGTTGTTSTGISRKQFMLLEGLPILVHTVRKFVASPMIHDIVVAVREEEVESVEQMLKGEGKSLPGSLRVVVGGNTRQESVRKAFAALEAETDLVAVHDAVRPFIELDTIRKVVEEASVSGAAIVAIVPVDTVKNVSGAHETGARVRATLSRDRLVLAQTPQVFRYEILGRAIEAAEAENFVGTDESSLVEHFELAEVSVVLGSERNIKITRPGDMDLARFYFEQETRR